MSGQSYSVESVIGGLAAPQTPLLSWGASPPRPPPSISSNTTLVGYDTCTMIIVHACTMIIVHACTMTILHACTIAIVHFCSGSGERSPPVLQEVQGAQPPGIAGGLGGAAPRFCRGVWRAARPPNSKKYDLLLMITFYLVEKQPI